jgi:hypothetical protein
MVYTVGHKALIFTGNILPSPSDQGDAIAKAGESLKTAASEAIYYRSMDPRREQKTVIKGREEDDRRAQMEGAKRIREQVAAPLKSPSIKEPRGKYPLT